MKKLWRAVREPTPPVSKYEASVMTALAWAAMIGGTGTWLFDTPPYGLWIVAAGFTVWTWRKK